MDLEDIARRILNHLSWCDGIEINDYSVISARTIIEEGLSEVEDFYQSEIADLEAELSLRDDGPLYRGGED